MIGRLLCSFGFHRWRQAPVYASVLMPTYDLQQCERCKRLR